MLNRNVFIQGLDKLVNEYADRGFTLTEKKANQWYEYMKNLSDTEFLKKIDKCLMSCNHVPYMSDVLAYKEDELNQRPNEGAYRVLNP
jgi:hypothetical protein